LPIPSPTDFDHTRFDLPELPRFRATSLEKFAGGFKMLQIVALFLITETVVYLFFYLHKCLV
jgi:hypothetical protein